VIDCFTDFICGGCCINGCGFFLPLYLFIRFFKPVISYSYLFIKRLSADIPNLLWSHLSSQHRHTCGRTLEDKKAKRTTWKTIRLSGVFQQDFVQK